MIRRGFNHLRSSEFIGDRNISLTTISILTPQARAVERGRKLWQRSFFDHALRKEESLTDVACYIWENPVRAKIVEEPIDYAWSGSEVWTNWRSFYGRG